MNQITEIKTQIADLQDEMQLSKTLPETGAHKRDKRWETSESQ